MKEFIWANSTFKEEPKSNKAFEGIIINKKVQKSINVIMVLDGNIHMILASKRTKTSIEICASNWLEAINEGNKFLKRTRSNKCATIRH